MTYTFIAELCSDLPVSVCCRVMKVSTSGYYQRLAAPVTDTDWDEAHRANTVVRHLDSAAATPMGCPASAASSAWDATKASPGPPLPALMRHLRSGGDPLPQAAWWLHPPR